ncbi:MAG TPA: FAD-dependent oxidoreductase [bacterium]|nr:FAD-dependent oxidoreductase [bacterium]HOL47668.1 FAD-dependent oxidoreductase [bacterium]HPQ18425.1 FAD-dependent oxidoreductase [bacterium]
MSKIVIIGGSDVGIIAGLRIRELDKNSDVTIVSNNNFPNFSICGIPFFIGGEVKHYKDLAHRTAAEICSTGLKLMLNSTAQEIDKANKKVRVIDENKNIVNLDYDKLVIATGGKSIKPEIEGIDLPDVFFLRWIDEAIRIDEHLKKKQPNSVVVIGGGYIGLEMTEAFIRRGLKVTLIEFAERILTTVDSEFSEIVKNKLEEKGAKIFTGKQVKAIKKDNGQLKVIAEPDLSITGDMVLVAVGAIPETTLAKSIGIETGIKNAIKVNTKLETNIPDIYAGGDCVESFNAITKKPVYIALGTTAHKHGRIIAENICGMNLEYPGTLGTQSIKLFDLVVARTGLNDAEAIAAGFQPQTISFETWDHKVYYPPAYKTKIRFTADKITKRILGCQILGNINAEISKRIDIIAVAIFKEVTVPEFIQMDLSYTPPLSSPWDPVQMAAQEWLKL